jgi:hypothetical protein
MPALFLGSAFPIPNLTVTCKRKCPLLPSREDSGQILPFDQSSGATRSKDRSTQLCCHILILRSSGRPDHRQTVAAEAATPTIRVHQKAIRPTVPIINPSALVTSCVLDQVGSA